MAESSPPDRRGSARGQTRDPGAEPVAHAAARPAPSGEPQRRPQFNGLAPDSSGWRRPPHNGTRQAYAAIDLGTNNCRLLIARPDGEDFVVIDAFSRVVRLGEGLAQTGRL